VHAEEGREIEDVDDGLAEDQVWPPSVVCWIVPNSPTSQPFRSSAKATS
jgi:hypothetical protein